MTLRIAINGFGRIGRNVLRALYTQGYRQDLQIVAINDLGDSSINAHLLKYDTVHGTFDAEVAHDQESLTVNGDRIAVSAIRNPADLPWAAHKIDVVFECTGLFTDRDKAAAHITAGARKVIISAPAKGADATVVYGVNHDILRQSHQIISNASCTTNCLAPVAQVLHRELGIESGLMTTIHAYTNDQNLTVNGDRISVTAIRNPAELPWAALNIDVVFECTGLFTERSKAQAHITAGARKVIISAPGKNADATVVYGVNHDILRQSHHIISNASCTTNCLAPVAQILHREFGIENGLMTTIHAYTN